jgi:hypothetical protein
MTRKLAVTVFAMSLALVGCGSSSTTKVTDAGNKDAMSGADVVVQPDMVTANGPETGSAGPEVQQAQPDAAVDTNNVVPPPEDGGVDAGDVGSASGPEAGATKFDGGVVDVPAAKLDAPDADGAAGDGGEVGDGGDGGEVG